LNVVHQRADSRRVDAAASARHPVQEIEEMAPAESITPEFSFHVEYVGAADQVVRSQRLTQADFGRAILKTSFDAFRRGLVDKYQPLPMGVLIEPLFPDANSASPRVKGFCVAIPLPADREHRSDFDISYFGASANRVRSELLRTEAIPSDQELYYRLNAFLDEEAPIQPVNKNQPVNKLAISLGPPIQNLSLALGDRRAFGPAEPWDEPSDADLPVLIDQHVVTEAVAEARENPEREVAGFLLGHLTRNQETKEVFVAVTGLASANSTTEATAASVTWPFITLRPLRMCSSRNSAPCGPSARRMTNGSVALLSAYVEVRGTPPGMLATQ
jgi:hypothetical protein